jgi:hypothetical protein
VVSEISFPAKLLEFDRSRRGLSAQAAEADVSVAPAESKDDVTTIRVTVSVKEGKQLFPGGVADLTFRVREDVSTANVAKEGLKVTVKNVSTAWTDKAPPTQIAGVVGRDGEIEVTMDAPVAACFFYMH